MDSEMLEQDSEPEAAFETVDPRSAEVYAWRLSELARAGYSVALARPLAEDGRIDLHRACDLLRQGCPELTAYRILA